MMIIIGIIAGLVVGALAMWLFYNSKLNTQVKKRMDEVEAIKRDKLLEVKEKFLNKKAELEKEVSARNQKIQANENRLKQKEMQLNQRHEELNRKINEAEAVRQNLDNQIALIDVKKEELEKMQMQEHYIKSKRFFL